MKRDRRDIEFERKVKELSNQSGLKLWYVGNVLRWRRSMGMPVYALEAATAPLPVPVSRVGRPPLDTSNLPR